MFAKITTKKAAKPTSTTAIRLDLAYELHSMSRIHHCMQQKESSREARRFSSKSERLQFSVFPGVIVCFARRTRDSDKSIAPDSATAASTTSRIW